jgi:hypothetical protein
MTAPRRQTGFQERVAPNRTAFDAVRAALEGDAQRVQAVARETAEAAKSAARRQFETALAETPLAPSVSER